MKFADLHLHTIYSDGTSSPQELVEGAKAAGLAAISVVDHDTVSAIVPTITAAAGKIEVLPGIELTAGYQGLEIHILGYLIDYQQKDLAQKLVSLREVRVARIYEIIAKLKKLGVDLDAQEVFNLNGKGTVGRLHVARAMLKTGKVSSIFEAFQKYIGDNGPAYVLGFHLSVKEAIKIITEAGGVAVLAHPYSLHREDLILEFIRLGIKGLEIYYPEHSQSMINYYLSLAKEHDLLVTGGSDFHGSAKPEVKIGLSKIPYVLVEKLKAAQKGPD